MKYRQRFWLALLIIGTGSGFAPYRHGDLLEVLLHVASLILAGFALWKFIGKETD